MSLTAGTRVGAYEILAPLGTGGMGEVYRARDPKLHRDVALKILPEIFATDPERVARFEREAKTLASLNHPHIAQIYGFEHDGDTAFLVMELVDGEDLAQQIARGELPFHEALPLARQIAEALQAAHDNGIIHRDLKPSNVRVRADGAVKVLDFGLAKSIAPPADADGGSQVATAAVSGTRVGTVVGTVAYMSPEQARGQPVDRRTDIWAFGCVLFELLTGRRAFAGESLVDTAAAVLEREPDWRALPPTIPPALRSLLRRCLVKDQRNRMRDIGDVRLELDALQHPVALPAEAVAAMRGRRGWQAVVIAAVGGAVVGAFAMRLLDHPTDAGIAIRSVITLEAGASLAPTSAPTFSPDGRRLAYARVHGGTRMLVVRELTSFDARVLPGTEDAIQPFFSPDGRSIGFFAQGKLKRVALSGGAPVVLADAINPRGATWGVKNTIVSAPTPSGGLFEISDVGGAVRAVTTVDRQRAEGGHRWPEFLPDGRAVLFAAGPATTNTAWSEARIAMVRLETGERVDLVPRGTCPKYVGGVLFYVESNRLLAQTLDPKRPAPSASATTVLDNVAIGGGGAGLLTISSSGSLAYITGAPATPQPLVWVDRTGLEQPLAIAAGVYTTPRLSPDGHRVAVAVSTANTDIWLYDLDRGTSTRLTFEGGNLAPAWTPDGGRVAFASNRHGPSEIYWTKADGGGVVEQLTTSDAIHFPTSWSPDGRTLLVMSVNTALNTDVLMWSQGAGVQPFLQTPFAEDRAVFSPDGRWVAYVLNEANRAEVFVRAFAGGDRRWQISNAGGTDPVWSRNGRELFYRQGDDMMAVDVPSGRSFSAGTPRRLFSGGYAGGVVASYDVSADGRFLMVRAPAAAETREIRIAVGWLDDARRKVADVNR